MKKNILNGKTIFFLGSSVTHGENGRSMAELLGEMYGCNIVKSAVPGTTIAGPDDDSYVARFDKLIESGMKAPDVFVCQLSTNDSLRPEKFGSLASKEVRRDEEFDVNTFLGGTEHIISVAKRVWKTRILFYTNSYFDRPLYAEMVRAIKILAEVYDFSVLDMFTDKKFNDITPEKRKEYMSDDIHPTIEGYRDWWLPRFVDILQKCLKPVIIQPVGLLA